MEKKFIKLAVLTIALFNFSCTVAQKETATGIVQSDILLNGKKVYRNYPKEDSSYKDWDKNAKLISSYIDEEFGTLYEDKIKDSIIFRKGTNDESKYTEFWWFKLVSQKDSIYLNSKNVTLRVGTPVNVIQKTFPDMWQLYQQEREDAKKKEREIQLHTTLLFHFYEDDKEYSEGSFQVYVQNGVITKITINFMTEGDMP